MKVSSQTLLPIVIDELNDGKKVTIKVKGTSMWPFYKDSKTNVTLIKGQYKKWDVVLALYNNQYVLHRIIKVYNDGYVLRGDGAIRKEFVLNCNIFGKVICYQTRKQKNESNRVHRLIVIMWVYSPFRRIMLLFKK